MATATVDHQRPLPAPLKAVEAAAPEACEEHPELKIYSHSRLFYWWPIWVVGYIMALVTYLGGEQYQIGNNLAWFHASENPGVIYALTVLLVILVTNVTVRGLASAIVILSGMCLTLLFAYLDWWEPILAWCGRLRIHLNMGFYVFFSTVMFLFWALVVFVFDRMSFWRIKPGQITHEYILGAGAKSYDTDNMILEKLRDDFFRHWVLGLGSGDLRIQPLAMGAHREEICVPNVLFIGSKMKFIQRMIAIEPDRFGHTTVK